MILQSPVGVQIRQSTKLLLAIGTYQQVVDLADVTSGRAEAAATRRFAQDRFGSLLDGVSHGVFHAANGILDFAGGLLSLAVSLQLCIADRLAYRLLDRAFDFMRGSRDPILIHDHLLLLYRLAA